MTGLTLEGREMKRQGISWVAFLVAAVAVFLLLRVAGLLDAII